MSNSPHGQPHETLLGIIIMLVAVGVPVFLGSLISGASPFSSLAMAVLAIAVLLAPVVLVQLLKIRSLANGRYLGAASSIAYLAAATSGSPWPLVDIVLAFWILVLSTKPHLLSRVPERGTLSWAGARPEGMIPPRGSDIEYPLREIVALMLPSPFLLRGAAGGIGLYSSGVLSFAVGTAIVASVFAFLACIAITILLFPRDGAV